MTHLLSQGDGGGGASGCSGAGGFEPPSWLLLSMPGRGGKAVASRSNLGPGWWVGTAGDAGWGLLAEARGVEPDPRDSSSFLRLRGLEQSRLVSREQDSSDTAEELYM